MLQEEVSIEVTAAVEVVEEEEEVVAVAVVVVVAAVAVAGDQEEAEGEGVVGDPEAEVAVGDPRVVVVGAAAAEVGGLLEVDGVDVDDEHQACIKSVDCTDLIPEANKEGYCLELCIICGQVCQAVSTSICSNSVTKSRLRIGSLFSFFVLMHLL